MNTEASNSLDEILDGEDEGTHCLACACAPLIMFCGIYCEEATGVDFVSPGDKICQRCLEFWQIHGCPRCPCGPQGPCQLCVDSADQGLMERGELRG